MTSKCLIFQESAERAERSDHRVGRSAENNRGGTSLPNLPGNVHQQAELSQEAGHCCKQYFARSSG